ncbi:bel12-ag transposon polyprotein [Lasius niger]|uniref:Bel12-ag transposon polyprotein n=1 Tax=Lasius niger TaxID=67767 RepID=A0A0J7KBW8_LASNI|nr:bel12-ag transposon polyprotein [Lasius niger]
MIEDIEDRNEVNQLDPCEQHFTSTVLQQDGRYVVSLPKNSKISLGNSRDMAQKRLLAIERRLQKQPELREAYHDYLNEYLLLNRMSEIDKEVNTEIEEFYLPHQAVIRKDKLTTKIREY